MNCWFSDIHSEMVSQNFHKGIISTRKMEDAAVLTVDPLYKLAVV